MNSRIFLATALALSIITSVSAAETAFSVSAATAGETTIATATSANSGTLQTTFKNSGLSVYSSTQLLNASGFQVTNSFAAIGNGSYSASMAPHSYMFFPKNVPNPTWKILSVGSATYKV